MLTDTPRGPSIWKLIAAFAAVYIIWGSTYLGIRIAVETIPPLLMAGTRFTVAGGVLYLILRARGVPQPAFPQWRSTLIIGGLLLLGGNGGVSWSEQHVPSGVAALLVATVPLWMALLDMLRGGERPGWKAALGLVLGLGGILLLIGPAEILGGVGGIDPVGSVVLIFASLSWAIGSLYARHADIPSTPLMGTALEMLLGGVLLLVAGTALGEAGQLHLATIAPASALALLYLTVFGSLVGFSAYTWLLRVTTPARAATYAYVNPVIAVILGWALLDEPLTVQTGLAAGVIVFSVVLITLYSPRHGQRQQYTQRLAKEVRAAPEDVVD
ncbi:MAG: drug/metabolite exporter YedA [Rudaea sp.]